MENIKYGVYPGEYINVEQVENYSEIDLYLRINQLNGDVWLANYLLKNNQINEDSPIFKNLIYALEYLIYKTKKFGVELTLPENNELITLTDSYNSWYEYYTDHFQGKLTDDEWEIFNKLRASGKDYSMFLPDKMWSESADTKLSLI